MLSLIWPAGLAFGEILTSNDMEALDASQARAIDGVGGGTYAPSATIVINGAGLQVATLLIGDLTVNGSTQLGNTSGDTLSVTATSTFSSPVTFDDDVAVNGAIVFTGDLTAGSVTINSDATIGNSASDALTVGATTEFNAPVTLADSLLAGDAQFNGDVQIGNTSGDSLAIVSRLSTALGFTGSGRIPWRLYTGLSSSVDSTITVATGNLIRVPHNQTALRTYTVSNSGAQDGDFMIFYQGFQGSGSNMGDQVNFNFGTFTLHWSAGSSANFMIAVFRSGAWEVLINYAA